MSTPTITLPIDTLREDLLRIMFEMETAVDTYQHMVPESCQNCAICGAQGPVNQIYVRWVCARSCRASVCTRCLVTRMIADIRARRNYEPRLSFLRSNIATYCPVCQIMTDMTKVACWQEKLRMRSKGKSERKRPSTGRRSRSPQRRKNIY